MRPYRVKEERPETSRNPRPEQTQDLRELVNDRVELLQQVFSCLRTKELQSVMPDSLKHLPINNVKELCLEELLGISSKRLAAVLSGTEPPSDTESSDDEQRPPISLDSISSDESALSNAAESKKKRRKHKESKKRSKKKGSSKSRKAKTRPREAERAGLTVLELLELQARARAIRAQLLAEPKPPQTNNETASCTVVVEQSAGEDDDVLIKEEPPEVVELISTDDDDEKPDIAALDNAVQQNVQEVKQEEKEAATSATDISEKSTVIKKNDLTIIVPKAPLTKKIKLKRDKFVSKPGENNSSTATVAGNRTDVEQKLFEKENPPSKDDNTKQPVLTEDKNTKLSVAMSEKPATNKTKKKNKSKKSLKNKFSKKEDSDNDEIMLQLSDSEKMDLLEDFYPKQQDKRSPADTEDSEASSSEDEQSSQDLESSDLRANSLSHMNAESKKTTLTAREKEINITPNDDSEKIELQNMVAIENNESETLITKDLNVSKNPTSPKDNQIEDIEENHFKDNHDDNSENIDKQAQALGVENQSDSIAEKHCYESKKISIEKDTQQTLSRCEVETAIIETPLVINENLQKDVNTETQENKTNDTVINSEENQVLDTQFNEYNDKPKTDLSEEANTDPISNNALPSQITEASKKKKSKKVKKLKKKNNK